MEATEADKRLKTFKDLDAYLACVEGKRGLRRVLISNNGIAAVKFIRSIRSWSYATFNDERVIQFVAMATPEDLMANAEYIRMSDQVCHVPGGSNVNNYANVNLILEVAQQYAVDAVWAGWGHASENPRLPNSLDKLGIAFIGPPGAPMYALGDKIGSTIIAQSAGVPTIAWNGDGLTVDYKATGEVPADVYAQADVTTVEEAKAIIARLGCPVMIKASEGGGGKGIRRVDDPANVEAAFRQVQSELPGSPIFIMRLSAASRHLEVQLLADQYGQAIALSGRDCSVQRRHQKILEEGPPVAARPEAWRRMEHSAVLLALEVGYVNAGTVEYLYNDRDEFFFLELNPRLQVEHPVTEMITGVNLPACQLQVAMGVPLHRIPDVRRYYGQEDLYSADRIDFLGEFADPPTRAKQRRTHGHCVAARITAENPFKGFQPTSGQITEINFRSSRNVWGYFSVDSSGRVHEFADSQIGHVFAWGENREEARRALAMALNDLSIRGEIRTTIEYLRDLIEVPDYKANRFDTTWLDARIKRNIQVSKIDPVTVVLVGAVCTAHKNVTARTAEYLAMLERGQLPPSALLKQSHAFQLIYDEVKYVLEVLRTGETTYRVRCNSSSADAELRQLADGGFLVMMGGKSHVAYAKADVGAQRYIVDGQTCLFADEYDPTQMRAAAGGKLLRYLVADQALVAKGAPFAEVEVMKMNMQLNALEEGVVTLLKPEGSVMEPGDIICTMALSDPSKVRKAVLYAGALPALGDPWPQALHNMPHQTLERSRARLEAVLLGYAVTRDMWETALRSLLQALRSPLLPMLDIEGQLSRTKNLMNSKVVRQVEDLCNAYRAAAAAAEPERAERAEADVAAFATQVLKLAEALKSPQGAALAAVAKRYAGGLAPLLVETLGALIARYVKIEAEFAEYELSDAAEKDDVVQELRAAHSKDLKLVLSMTLANLSREPRDQLVVRMLGLLEREAAGSHKQVRGRCKEVMHEVAQLQGLKCSDVALEARQALIEIENSYADQLRHIEHQLRAWSAGSHEAFEAIVSSTDPVLTFLMDIVVSPQAYDAEVRAAALRMYVHRVYASYKLVDVRAAPVGLPAAASNNGGAAALGATFTFFSDAAAHHGGLAGSGKGMMMTSVSSVEDLTSFLNPGSKFSLQELAKGGSKPGPVQSSNQSDADASSVGMDLDSFDAEERPPRHQQQQQQMRRGSVMARQYSDLKARAESVEASMNHNVPPFVHRRGMLMTFADLPECEALLAKQLALMSCSGESVADKEALAQQQQEQQDGEMPLSVVHVLLCTDVGGEARFGSAVARRLQAMAFSH